MAIEPTYVHVDESGEEEGQANITKNARLPKTKAQKDFIKWFPRMQYFPTASSHKMFRDYEDVMRSGTDDAILHRGWLAKTKAWVTGKNKFAIVIKIRGAFGMLLNESKFLEYSATKEAQEYLKNAKADAGRVNGVSHVGKEITEEGTNDAQN